jgi:hypothetical protein
VGQQPGAFISGDAAVAGQLLHETDDARMRFGAKRRTAETHPCIRVEAPMCKPSHP